MTRRSLGRLLIVGLMALAAHGRAAMAAPPKARPSFLLVIADDWSHPHAGVHGDRVVRTPSFDRVAAEGMLLANAFAAAPSCTPSRAAILSGQHPHRLAEGAQLWGFLPARFAVYPDLLEEAGYAVGLQGKGWGPGNFEAGGRTRNPAGPPAKSFAEFLKTLPAGKPFAYWFGSQNPHRSYEAGSGRRRGLRAADVAVPPFLIDRPEVREDLLDYYAEVERFDEELGELLAALEAAGRTAETLVVVTSDNGMPFPRAKTNLHDAGSRVPLAVRWPGVVKARGKTDAFVNLMDLAPTFLEAAGLPVPADMTGRSLLPLLRTGRDRGRDQVFLERERHANVRKGDLAYPARAVRTRDFLYVRNLRPDRWPGGDPELWKAVGPYGDCDESPSKRIVIAEKDAAGAAGKPFQLAFAKRPAEELYDLRKDPFQLANVVGVAAYAAPKKKLAATLDAWMRATADPRVDAKDDRFDAYPYFGSGPKGR